MAYSGEVIAIPLGEAGLTGSRALAKVPENALLLASNISYDTGSIRKEGGAEKYNTTALPLGTSIIGGHDWWPVPGVQRMVVYTGSGAIYKDSGGGAFSTTLATGLSGAGVPVFAQGGQEEIANDRKLFICNGMNAPRVLAGDGASAPAIALPAADWGGSRQPISMTSHDGRMWAAMEHRIYYSTVEDHEDFTDLVDAGSFAVYPGVGDKIVQIMSYKGLLVIWKYPTGIFYIDTTSPILQNWGVRRLSEAVGGVSPLGACQVSDDVLFLDQAGNVQLLSGIQEYGTIGFKNLSQLSLLAPFLRDNVNLSRLPYARTVFYAHKLEAHIALSQSGTGVNNARLVVDFNRPGASRFRWSPRDVCESLWLRRDIDTISRPLVGDSSGFVWRLDQDIFRKGTEGYTAEFQTPHMDFRWVDPKLATLRKNGAFLEIICDPTGDWVLFADVYWDNVLTQTITFNVQPDGAVIGAFVLGTDALGAPASVALRKRLQGSGKRLSLHFYNENIDEDFNISDAFVSFTLGDERNI